MIGWSIISALTLKTKIIIAAALIAASFWAFRQWLNKHDSRIEQETRIKVSAEILKAKRVEWAEREADIAKDAAGLEIEKASINDARARLDQDRINLSRSLRDGLAAIQKERSRQYEGVASVPDTQLWDAIRAVSRELASAQR